ncbi:MAG TPA: caspase family protein [Pirellulales bacterium]|nr:caspase family protein [Pirellulales bacterium]
MKLWPWLLVAVVLLSRVPCALAEDALTPVAGNQSAPASNAAAPNSTPAVDPTKFHALLVGCTKYDNLKPERSLHGPANDVELVRRFFTDQLHLPLAGIAVLSEAEAAVRGSDFRPTHDNIVREIQNLIDVAHEGDQVVLLLAGHGGQQPERKDPDPTYLKPDGLDQMFLPCDCGQWSGKKWCVEKGIPDYELRSWCKQITNQKKARLWVILDACCSGWTLRGNSTEVTRSISTDDLGIPENDLADARKAAAARQPASRGGEPLPAEGVTQGAFEFSPQSPDYVGIYAAQRDESELEMPMPCDAEGDHPQKVQGLLTYAIVDILSRTSRPITYGELANLIRQRYPQWGRTTGPTPVVEGLAQDREVLGVQRWPGRSSQRWQKDDSGNLTVNEGEVQGLSPGTILTLHPSVDQPDAAAVLGYAKVEDCELLDSTVKPTRYNDTREPRKSALPNGGWFEVAQTDYGSLRVKVGVDMQPVVTDASADQATLHDEAESAALRRLGSELKSAVSKDDSLCQFADNPQAAQWIVQLRDTKLMLLSKDAAEIRGKLPEGVSRFSIPDDQPVPAIVRDMTRIARAQNLLNLTAAQQAAGGVDATGGDPSHPNVDLKIMRFKSKTDRQGVEIELTKGPLTLITGDHIGWQMTNRGPTDVAVSLLYIDAGFGIQAIYPRPGSGTDNMLTKHGGAHTTKAATITANPVGTEHVVLIAVPRLPEHQAPDFSFLEQESLPLARGADDPVNASLESPLGRLLKNAMYGTGGTRGLDSTDAVESQLTLQSWRVVGEPGS